MWISGGGSYSTFSDLTPKAARELKYGQSFYGEVDVMDRYPFLTGHYGYRSTTAQDVKILVENQAPTELDFKLITHEFGGKALIPLQWFDIYFGTGVIFGNATLGEKERSAFGRYWHAGFHWFLNPHLGIKFAYQGNKLITSEFSNLDDKKLRFDHGVYSIGLVLRFGDFKF